jgi:uncharacterized membrane protein
MPMRYVVAYVATMVVFLGLDFSFLILANPTYKQEIGPLLLTTLNIPASAAFYLTYLFGIVLFVVAPGLKDGRWRRVLLMGAAFGLVAYATYDLTNLATLKGFSVKIVMIDLVWGMVVTGASSTVGYLAARRFG